MAFSSRPLWKLAAILGVLGATATGACIEDDVPNYPILIDPCDGGSCIPSSSVEVGVTSSGATSSASSSSGTGGSTSTSDLTGDVHLVSQPTFVEGSSTYADALTIELFPASGAQQNLPYGGDAGAGFDAKGIAPGKAWIVALDASMGTAGIWSTVSAVDVPQIAPVALPVVDAAMLASLASTLPGVGSTGLSTTAAQIVVTLTHAGQPLAGAHVTGAVGGAVVAYDTGAGTYSGTATATGSAGVILLLNSSLSGMTSITVTSASPASTVTVPVFAGAGIVTIASVQL